MTQFNKEFEMDVAALSEQILYSTAEAMIRYMESSDVIPVDTHNLKDSTGVGVYIDGVLKRYLQKSGAVQPKQVDGSKIWGRDIIVHALLLGETKYSQGYKIVLFSTMPYAEKQDKIKGYFSDVLVDEFRGVLDEIVKRYATIRN